MYGEGKMFSDVEAIELLCRGHALEWTGKGWRTIFEPEHVAPILYPGKRAAEAAWRVGASATFETQMACAGTRAAALMGEAGVNRPWC